jgi:hypothetical protein
MMTKAEYCAAIGKACDAELETLSQLIGMLSNMRGNERFESSKAFLVQLQKSLLSIKNLTRSDDNAE